MYIGMFGYVINGSIDKYYLMIIIKHILNIFRVFTFDRRTNNLEVLKEFDFHEHCVLKVRHHLHKDGVTRKEKLRLLSAATDGRVAFWDVADDVSSFLLNTSESNFSSKPSFDIQCHQSGINGLDLLEVQGYNFQHLWCFGVMKLMMCCR